ncbi:MAG: hypothetical protein HZA28_04575 [Candidatus Omnitrophica bacterium]|nr:hypothetical protein [Candidatus Omnitrophota bacterium]
MPRFRTKFLYWAGIVAVLFIIVVTIVFNILLGLSRVRIVQAANAPLNDRLDIGYIGYVFPNIVVLKGVVIHARDSLTPGQRLSIPTVTAEFSVLEFVIRQNVTIQKVKFYSPYVHDGYFRDFLSRNGKQLMTFLLELPRINFRFSVKEALWDFTRGAGSPDYTYLNFVFSMRKEAISVHGNVRRDKFGYSPARKTRWQRLATGMPWEFDFKGLLIDEGILIDNLDIQRKNLYLKLWGGLQKGQLRLNGFSFFDTYPREEYQVVKAKPGGRIQAYLQKFKKIPRGVSFDDKDIYLIDLDCLARLDLPKVHVERLNFSLNDTPVSINGDLLFAEPFPVDLNILVDPARSKTFTLKNLQKIQWHVTGALVDRIFTGDNDLSIIFDKAGNPNFPFERIDGSLKGLQFSVDRYARPELRVGQGEVIFRGAEHLRRLALENLRMSLNVLNKKLRLVEVQAPFYGGELAGKFWLTMEPSTSRIDGAVVLSDVDVSRLDELLFDFAQAEGRMSGRVHLTSVPRFNLDGQFDVYNGELERFAFFQWLADTFHLPSLQKIAFKQVSSGFSADADALKFQGILLKSDDVNIDGYFNVDKNNLVSSYLSLAFSKRLLGESPKFRPILKIFGEDIPAVIFDFQLSGRQDAMNFQWLPSAHKSMIQERIPNFIERIIERNIDEMIAPAAPAQPGQEQPSGP